MKPVSLADAKRLCLSVPIGLFATLVVVNVANAIGLNEAVQQSLLGEPLRVVIPVIVSDWDDAAENNLSSECAKLIGPGDDRSESDVPHLTGGRISLQRSARAVTLVVTSSRPINDPVLSVTVQVGCSDSIRRQYTLLLDPPAIDTTIVEAISPTPMALPSEARFEDIPVAPQATEAPVQASPSKLLALPRSKTPASQHKGAKKAPRANLASKPKPPAPQASASKPQLSVSRGVQDTEHGAQPSAADVEVESVVLMRRVEELSAMVQRMQQELEAARAARDAAEASAKRASLPSIRSSSLRVLRGREVIEEEPAQAYRELLLFVLALILIALLIELWSRRRVKRLPSIVTAIDLDTSGSMPGHDRVFDNSEPTMSPSPLIDVEEVSAESAGATPLASTGRPNAARAASKTPLFHYDPELAFDEDIQFDTGPRTPARAP